MASRTRRNSAKKAIDRVRVSIQAYDATLPGSLQESPVPGIIHGRLGQWGNSKAIRLSQRLLAAAGIDANGDQEYAIEAAGRGRLVVTFLRQRSPRRLPFAPYDVDELLGAHGLPAAAADAPDYVPRGRE